MDTAESASAELEPLTFDEKIELKPFFWLSLKNALLNIITFTLYRFWGKTEVRRRLWARIRMNGEAFEYTGRGKELFLGFLLALVVLGIPYLILLIAYQFLSRGHFLLVFFPIYLGFFVLIGAAMFLAFRYIASRTTWRGVRFLVRGSATDYGLSVFAYSMLTAITFGWYGPAMKMRLAEKLWGELRFGDQRFRWREPKGHSVYGPFAVFWLLGVGGYVAVVLAFAFLGAGAAEQGFDPEIMAPEAVKHFITGPMIAGLMVLPLYFIAVIIAWGAYQAAILRRIAASLTFGNARFSLKVGALSFIGLLLVNILILIFSLGLLVPLVQARTARYLVRRLTSAGGAPIHAALQASPGPRTGEGLADAFDVGFI